jgi:hypothetical protein
MRSDILKVSSTVTTLPVDLLRYTYNLVFIIQVLWYFVFSVVSVRTEKINLFNWLIKSTGTHYLEILKQMDIM